MNIYYPAPRPATDAAAPHIQAAIDHADVEHTGWSVQARNMLLTYIEVRRGKPFICFDVRRWAERRGLPVPPTERAWGGIIQWAYRQQLIRRVGYTAAPTEADMHRQPVAVWQS